MNDWTKNDNPCLDKAGDDEPLFVLRAQDELAPEVVEGWAEALADSAGDQEKVDESERIADLMRDWQHRNGSKLPD